MGEYFPLFFFVFDTFRPFSPFWFTQDELYHILGKSVGISAPLLRPKEIDEHSLLRLSTIFNLQTSEYPAYPHSRIRHGQPADGVL